MTYRSGFDNYPLAFSHASRNRGLIKWGELQEKLRRTYCTCLINHKEVALFQNCIISESSAHASLSHRSLLQETTPLGENSQQNQRASPEIKQIIILIKYQQVTTLKNQLKGKFAKNVQPLRVVEIPSEPIFYRILTRSPRWFSFMSFRTLPHFLTVVSWTYVGLYSLRSVILLIQTDPLK